MKLGNSFQKMILNERINFINLRVSFKSLFDQLWSYGGIVQRHFTRTTLRRSFEINEEIHCRQLDQLAEITHWSSFTSQKRK